LIATQFLAAFLLVGPTYTWSQDAPGRFELGGNFTTLRFSGAGTFGPGVEGDVNFGRHFSLDGTYSWLPSNRQHVMTALIGGKAGFRTQRFGFFAKVRPGIVSQGNFLRQETFVLSPAPPPLPPTLLISTASSRFGRLTERALDVGGVAEYYPSRHWSIRWDIGDLIRFQERGPTFTTFLPGNPNPNVFSGAGQTKGNFQFSTGIHYRF
jgi:hypothetical protein